MQLFSRHLRREPAPSYARSNCPRCDSGGIVQVVDLVRGVDVNHCPQCSNRWEHQRSDSAQLTTT